MVKYVKLSAISQQAINDVVEALVNDFGRNENAHYTVHTHPVNELLLLELFADGKLCGTIYLVQDRFNWQYSLNTMALINAQAETLFREETTYGVKDRDGVKRILGAVLNGYGNMEFYPGVIKKAAAYWYKIATSQMFHNGNKRTALMSGLYYLVMNGFILKAVDGNSLYRLTLELANERMTQSELESFIRGHVGLRYFSSLAEVESDDRFELKIPFEIDNPDRSDR